MAFTIQLDDGRKTYRPGDTIHGTVTYRTSQPQRIHIVTVQIKGVECVDWNSLTSGGTASEELWQANTFLSIDKRIEVEEKLQPGTHVFPFKITLPTDLPSTFNYQNCWVTFLIMARILQQTVHTVIKVDAPLDLNLMKDATLLTPACFTSTENSSFLCWINNFKTMEVYMKRRAFSYVESPQIEIEVYNRSWRHIWWITLTLKTMVEVLAPDYAETHKIFRLFSKGTTAHSVDSSSVASYTRKKIVFNFEHLSFAVVYNFTRCQLLRQKSYIEVRCFRKHGPDLVVEIPVLLGHIPLRRHDGGLPAVFEGSSKSSSVHSSRSLCPPDMSSTPIPSLPYPSMSSTSPVYPSIPEPGFLSVFLPNLPPYPVGNPPSPVNAVMPHFPAASQSSYPSVGSSPSSQYSIEDSFTRLSLAGVPKVGGGGRRPSTRSLPLPPLSIPPAVRGGRLNPLPRQAVCNCSSAASSEKPEGRSQRRHRIGFELLEAAISAHKPLSRSSY